MASLSRRSTYRDVSAWPGWVDALSSLIMVVIFLLMVFVVAQFYLATALTGRDEQLVSLNRKMAELNELLTLERDSNADLRANIGQLSNELQASIAAREDMTESMAALQDEREQSQRAVEELQATIRADRETIELRLREAASLQSDLKALREARQRLEGEIATVTAGLRLSEEQRNALGGEIATVTAGLRLSEEQRNALLAELGSVRDRSRELEQRLATADEKTMLAQQEIDKRDIRVNELLSALAGEQEVSNQSRARIDLLNQQMASLRDQLARIGAALEVSEARTDEQRVQIAELGSRLNQALATKVQELARYRSEFFGRVREVLGNRQDIRIVGDRFVFQSELLFPSGSALLEGVGKERLAQLARSLIDIGQTIPSDINWVLRVDGHTDDRPIATPQFPSNWELSSARAIAVVKYLTEQGIPADRLAAAGFGEFQPLDRGTSDEIRSRNRRIELKLDQR